MVILFMSVMVMGRMLLMDFGRGSARTKNIYKPYVQDLSAAYTRAVSEHLPNAALVVDHFHVTKLMNEKLDLLRRDSYGMRKRISTSVK